MEHRRTPIRGSQGDHDSASMELPSPAPILTSERIDSIDILRGVALLGILPMNILWFALPGIAFLNPSLAGGFTGPNFAAWVVCYVLFDEKMMTIFSMLFGAGLVLMTERMQHRGYSPAAFFYRRSAILLLIGLAHAYLLWAGDILVSYALCGMLVYPLRKLSPRALIVLGLLVMLPSAWLSRRESADYAAARNAAERVQTAKTSGDIPSDSDSALAQNWDRIQNGFHPSTREIAETVNEQRQGSYWQLARNRAPNAFGVETTKFGRTFIWTITGRMLIGMALMKLCVFSGQRSPRFYLALALVGYGLGLPIVGLGAYRLIEHDFDVVYLFGGGTEFNDFGSLLVALGHVGMVVSIHKAGLANWLMKRFAAVGRMALSNYLLQSVICSTLFYGYGFGLFGALDRAQLLAVVVGIWAFQLWVCPVWLKTFRFGPVEWFWRSLTYRQAQPMWNPKV